MMMTKRHRASVSGTVKFLLAAGFYLGFTQQAAALQVRVTVENLSNTGGLFLTPAWVGFHNGSFDSYNAGSSASAGLQQIAEDGNPAGIQAEFSAAAPSGTSGVIFGPAGFSGAPIIDPGEKASAIFNINAASSGYFSFISMVIPSNDAFIGNDNAIALFNGAGVFTGTDFIVFGNQVMDAGTEVNTELDAAFLNQSAPNTGLDEFGVVRQHAGFNGSIGNPGGIARILGGTNAAGLPVDPASADFTAANFQLARISVTAVPEPETYLLFLIGLASLGFLRRRQKA